MTIEKVYLLLILVFFILAFAVKNITTYFATKNSIRGQSIKLTASITLSSIIYVLIGLRIVILDSTQLIEVVIPFTYYLKICGFTLVTLGFGLGVLSLIAMKNSWRVGIKYDQKTALVTTGIYRFSRNPYFLSYDILILGYILIYPSPIFVLLYLPLVIIFHNMIIEEEEYLKTVHKSDYSKYQQEVNRYLSLW